MKLLTHNMLTSPNTRNGFPLAIEVEKMETVEAEYNSDFVVRMIEKLEYPALVGAIESLGMPDKLPATIPPEFGNNEEFLRALHHVLLEIEIIDGSLICP